MLKNKFYNKVIASFLAISLLFPSVGNIGNVFADNETNVNVTVSATDVNITVPLNFACAINPNLEKAEGGFSYADNLTVTNESKAPILLSVNAFVDNAQTFTNDVLPDGLPEGKEWNKLNVKETKEYFALGLKATDSSEWFEQFATEYSYAKSINEESVDLGVIGPGRATKFDLDAFYGRAVKEGFTFSYNITWLAELYDGEGGSGSSNDLSNYTPDPNTVSIDKEENTALEYELNNTQSASIGDFLDELLGVETVHAASANEFVSNEEFDESKVVGTATISGIKDESITSLYIADYYEDAEGNLYKIVGVKSGASLNAPNLKTLVLGEGMTEIPEEAFFGNMKLESIFIPSKVTTIGKSAFENCQHLDNVYFAKDSQLETVGEYAFANASIHCIYLPSSVKTIGQWAFYDVYKAHILGDLDSVASSAFINTNYIFVANEEDKGLFTSTVTKGSVNIIQEASAKLEIYLDGALQKSLQMEGLYVGDTITAPEINKLYTIPEGQNLRAVVGINMVDADAEKNVCQVHLTASDLETMEESENIGFFTVMNGDTVCLGANISYIYIPKEYSGDTVYTVRGDLYKNSNPYKYCLTEVVLPSSISKIYEQTFNGCMNLNTINIPSSVTQIGMIAFSNCTSLATVELPSNLRSLGNSAFSDCRSLTEITIPSKITTIPSSAFRGCSNLTSVNFAEGSQITSIEESAFADCLKLENVNLPEGITSLGKKLFNGCTNLTEVVIPEGVTSIGESAFYNCSSLTSVTIPSTVQTIGQQAFSNIANVIYNGEATGSPWGAKTVNGFVEGDFVYTDETKTTVTGYVGTNPNITIPSTATTIGQQAFYGCTALKSVSFEEGSQLISIGANAFNNCTALASIEIPSTVTEIGSSAFRYCTALTTVNYRGSQQQWNTITISYSNDPLTTATINYNYSE